MNDDNYTFQQYLIGIYVFLDEYFKKYTARQHLSRALKVIGYVLGAALFAANVYALSLILYSFG